MLFRSLIHIHLHEPDRLSDSISETILLANTVGHKSIVIQLLHVIWRVAFNRRFMMTVWYGGGIDPGFDGLGVRSQGEGRSDVGCQSRERGRRAGCILKSGRHGVCKKRGGRLDGYRNLTKKKLWALCTFTTDGQRTRLRFRCEKFSQQ